MFLITYNYIELKEKEDGFSKLKEQLALPTIKVDASDKVIGCND